MSTAVERGFARAKALTRHHSKSFYFASIALFGERRRAAFALYAFCRGMDDLVDAAERTLEQKRAALDEARVVLDQLFSPEGPQPTPHFEADVLAAVAATVRRWNIPREPFDELLLGMEMDLVQARYSTWDELDVYCHRVAGVVGLMMSPVLGVKDARAARYAAALGKAMQLTNILRDVKEDLERGRVYLPSAELARFGVTESDLAAGRVDERFTAFMQFQLARARELYAEGAKGFSAITHFGARTTVRLMAAVYSGILEAIVAARFDVFSRRARVSLPGKLLLAAKLPLTP
ncbi:MAG: phytoene/squalene synthase family protein [Myxococcota bacterium]